MIDTDQYEGHLPFTGDEKVWIWSNSGMNRMKSVKQFHVTARLLEDAPALLAEVKRLRAWKKLVSDIVQQQDGSHLREMLKELIE